MKLGNRTAIIKAECVFFRCSNKKTSESGKVIRPLSLLFWLRDVLTEKTYNCSFHLKTALRGDNINIHTMYVYSEGSEI